MRLERHRSVATPNVDLTSMIDVVFLLIIFFLVSSHLARAEHRQRVDLIGSQTATINDQVAARPADTVLTLDADGQMWHLGDRIDLRWLDDRSGGPVRSVTLRVDYRCGYEAVGRWLGRLSVAGTETIDLAVLPGPVR